MKIEITIPSKASEIKLKDYQRFAQVQGDEDFLKRKVAQIFCNIDDVLNVSKIQIDEIYNIVLKALEEKPKLVKHFELDGVKYGFEPNLEDLTYGQFLDLENYISDWQQMHKVIAVLYRPITIEKNEFYDIEKYTGTNDANKFREVNMEIVFGSLLFFYRIANNLLNHFLTSLEQEKQKQKISHTEDNSINDGGGLLHLQSYLIMMQQNLNKLHNSIINLQLPILYTKQINQN